MWLFSFKKKHKIYNSSHVKCIIKHISIIISKFSRNLIQVKVYFFKNLPFSSCPALNTQNSMSMNMSPFVSSCEWNHHIDMDVRLIWHIGHCNNALMDVEVRACLLVLEFIFYNMHLYEPQHSSIINDGRRYHPASHCCCAVGHSGQWFSRVLTSPFTANICLCLLFHHCYFHSSQTVLMCLWEISLRFQCYPLVSLLPICMLCSKKCLLKSVFLN